MVMMNSFTNGNNTWIWVVLLLLVVCAVIYFIRNKVMVEEEVIVDEEPDAALQHIAEYRTYMINQWICLLAFWFDIKAEEAQTKLTCPGFNQNTVYFFHENLEVYTFFDWNAEVMTVKTSVFREDEGYQTHEKRFTLAGKDLKTKELFEFIQQAKNEHYDYYDLSAGDVIAITKQLKIAAKGFPSDDAAKNHLFDHMADLMILMRDKKLCNNKGLFKTYMALVYWFWNTYGAEFIQNINMTEEEFIGKNANGGTNEGNE